MGAQFGKWNFDGEPVAAEYLKNVEEMLLPYGPDRSTSWSHAGISMAFFSFETTSESDSDDQPYRSPRGSMLTWDGRLDNREDLIAQLGGDLSIKSADVAIAAAAYQRWNSECLARLFGDWALTIWDPFEHVLILAQDPIGTRPLYYTREARSITWSTVLDPLVLLSDHVFSINEEYVAGCLALYPAATMTPFVGICGVPASSYARFTTLQTRVTKYWDFNPEKKIRYRTDIEYEEHFRAVFEQAVRRRLKSRCRILAELSGGMDSSSIVCMADKIGSSGTSDIPKLDTVSYYDDSEPAWDERPYFTVVERARGQAGCHIEITSNDAFAIRFDGNRFASTPGSCGEFSEASQQFDLCVRSKGYRVVLSGIGGDEVLGGIPTPIPELRDLIAQARFKTLARQLAVWALNKRKPWLSLLLESLRGFLPQALAGQATYKTPAPWLKPDFVSRNRFALTGYESRTRVFGSMPSFQENLNALDALRRQLAFGHPPRDPVYEKRYPYLDIELLKFVFAIPREQLLRPGQRRSLMRRALTGIVPDEILNRKRKASPSRRPMLALSSEWEQLNREGPPFLTDVLGIVDQKNFLEILSKSVRGEEVAIVQVMRTLAIEYWLRAAKQWTAKELGKRGPIQSLAPCHV